ncbi:MAG: molecular chaperone DnaJ [Rhodospirillaceae bacterium]
MTTQKGKGIGAWHGFTIDGDLHTCWLCQRAVSGKSLRCPDCGALQPMHDINHFALLGLEPRFDLDLDDLDRHYATARRTLDPERLAVKTPRAGTVAVRYTALMETAYDTLRNPVSRARYLLELEDIEVKASGNEPVAVEPAPYRSELDTLAVEVESAADCTTVDRLAAHVVHEIEACINSLSNAFRAGRTGEARLALAHHDRLQSLSEAARHRRLILTTPHGF